MNKNFKQYPLTDGNGNDNTIREVTIENKGNGWGMFFIITTVVFLGLSIYLYVNNMRANRTGELLSTKVIDSESRYNDLDSRYTATLVDLENYRGKNAELDSMISLNEKTINDLQASLKKDRTNRQLNEAEYKKHLADLDVVVSDLNTKIEQLQKEKNMLLVAKDSMGNVITVNTIAISDLQNSNSKLNTKVTIASLLIPEEITISGITSKSNGNESTTMKAEKSDYLKICLNLPANKTADAGRKTFLIRIINPTGSLLSENDSSGIFVSVENNLQMQSTLASSIQYANQSQQACSMWKPKSALTKGMYTTQIYQDGYLIASQKFELK